MSVTAVLHRFSVDDFHKMGEAGIFCEDDRVELIEGEIVDMSPIGNRHKSAVGRLDRLFQRSLPDNVVIQIQNPVRLGDESEPQPDVALLRWRDDFYAGVDTLPGDVYLLVEVAESSLAFDRGEKARVYAQNAISEYWVVDLEAKAIIVHRESGPQGYASVTTITGQETVSPLAFSEFAISAADIIL